MKIVVIGSGGRLGMALAQDWRKNGDEIIGFDHAALDLGNAAAFPAAFEALDFDVLVNCAAQTNVDRCETHPDEAMRINAVAVGALGKICAAKNRRCIHISTDYVFDGTKPSPYTEEDEARPISLYGQSKRAGEIALLEACETHLVVRVSWIFGPHRPSFVDGIVKRALQEERVEAISDKVAVPTYTIDTARLLRPLLLDIPVGGILHICNGGECSWQEYGQHAIDCALAAGLPVRATQVAPLKMADLTAFIARRPRNSAMSTARLAHLTGQTPRPWQEAVEEYTREHLVPRYR